MKKNFLILYAFMIHSISYAQWTRISSPTVSDLSDIHFPNESIGYIVSEKGIVLKSIDKGKSWHIIYNDSTKVFNSVFFTSLNTGYATSINHGVFKTADGGNSWNEVLIDSQVIFNDVAFFDSSHGYVASNLAIYKTNDSGNGWTKSLTNQANVSIAIPSSSTAYFIGSPDQSGTLIKTTNSGSSYQSYPLPFQSVKEKIQFLNDSIGFVCGWYSGYIVKTINGGKTWMNICPCQCWDMQFFDTLSGYYIDNSGGKNILRHTIDGGSNWQTDINVESYGKKLRKMQFINPSLAMVVGDSGIIYRNENISVGKTESYEHIEFNIYPNPVRQGIFIETHLSSNITIELSNALGQKIQHLVTSKNKSYIDLSENSSGLYFISVQSGNDKLIRKIIKE